MLRLSITSVGRDFCFARHNQSKTLLLLSLIAKIRISFVYVSCMFRISFVFVILLQRYKILGALSRGREDFFEKYLLEQNICTIFA
jgi:hypothetical protein